MASNLRREVLKAFKSLHRTRIEVFKNDIRALEAARKRINDEYKDKKHVSNIDSIQALISLSHSVEDEIKTSIIQAEEVQPGTFKLKITSSTRKINNVPYKECNN